MLSLIKQWLALLNPGPPSLDRMRLGLDSDDGSNPLMVRNYAGTKKIQPSR